VLGEDAFPADGAWRVFDRLVSETNIFFANEPAGMDQAWRDLTHSSQSGSNFWTDAYLAAFARTAGYTLVTFDRGFTKYRNTQVKLLGTAP
jgi:predicted nucleic acid-binding protein